MRRVLDAYPDRVLIGEVYLPFERLVAYYGRDMTGAHLPFNFQLIFAPWNAAAIARDRGGIRGGAAERWHGPTGCSAIMTRSASPPASVPLARGSLQCFF